MTEEVFRQGVNDIEIFIISEMDEKTTCYDSREFLTSCPHILLPINL